MNDSLCPFCQGHPGSMNLVAIVLSLNVGLKATLLAGVGCDFMAFGIVATLTEPVRARVGDEDDAPSASIGDPAHTPT